MQVQHSARLRPQSTTRILQPLHEKVDRALEFPNETVGQARHSRPVVLLHGTLVGKESIEAYREFALQQGHPVSHHDHPGITKGSPLETSTEIASREVNRSRAEIARKHLDSLQNADSDRLAQFFQLDATLYGSDDPDVGKIASLLPSVTDRVSTFLDQPQSLLETQFSGQLRQLESEVAAELDELGVQSGHRKKMAAQLVDTIAPKAILVGHSAGGFVAHTMVVNPEPELGTDLPFAYDGGHGVGEAVLLSAPVGKGLPKPAPPGILGLPFYNYDNQVLRPMEKLPQVRLARLNPVFDFLYGSTKAWMSAATKVATVVSLSLTSPLIHLARPGYQQVEEGADFFETYVKDKPVPDGVSVIAVTSPLDQLVQEDRSVLGTGQTNTHNISISLGVTEDDLQRERPTWSHVIMSEKPDSFKNQYSDRLAQRPEAMIKMLEPTNDDGVRHQALKLFTQEMVEAPDLLNRFPELVPALQKVADERMPFSDSPSFLASQILRSSTGNLPT
jgi:pimeloyl-ACP methyl ester carboxylesterase